MTEKDYSGAAHHPFGPSSLKQKLNCLASHLATEGLPDKDSEAALEGTAAHLLVEKCRELNVRAETFKGHIIDVMTVAGHSREFVVNDDMIASAQTFIDHINALPGYDFNEQRIHYPEWVAYGGGGFGTLDAARVTVEVAQDGHTVHLRDFKHGKGVQVYAKDNEQLLACALGFYRDWGHLFDIKRFVLGIVQPRRDWEDIWEVDLAYVLKWADEVLKPGVLKALTPGQPFNPDPKENGWCTFCKIKGTCKARAEQKLDVLTDGFDDVDDGIDKIGTAKGVGHLTNEQIARILPKAAGVIAWFADLKKYAFGEVAAGRSVGDMKIVQGEGDRAWVAGAKAELDKAAGDDLVGKLYTEPELKSPAQVEKVLGKERFKPAGKKKPAGDLHHLIVRPKGKPQLVPGSDPRPAVCIEDGFDEVEENWE